MKNLAIAIKTFYRVEPLLKLVGSIKKHLPDATMYIADDSYTIADKKAELYKELEAQGHKIVYPPKNSGISVGKNMIVKQVKEPYLLLCDDDFVLTEETNLSTSLKILEENHDVGIVCGLMVNQDGVPSHYEWNLEIVGDTIIKKYPQKQEGLQYVDLGLNFFLAKTEVFKDVMWDERLIVSTEHMDFFLSLKQTKWKVVYCSKMKAIHEAVLNDPTYVNYRHRAFHWHDFADKWGVTFIKKEGRDEVLNYHEEANKWADYKPSVIYRNDDVAVDSNLEQLRIIRGIFEKHDIYEHYSVVPYGLTVPLYDDYDPQMPLDKLNTILGHDPITKNKQVCAFLKESLDRGHSLILHGFTHTRVGDYDERAIYENLKDAKELLENEFRTKVRYFASPFNQRNDKIDRAVKNLQMSYLWNDGDALEQCVREGKKVNTSFTWYHFWRFFRGDLSPERLDEWLAL